MRLESDQVITERPQGENVCAAIVTYQPDAGFPERVARIAHQVDSVVIIDNNSNSCVVSMLEDLASQRNIHLIVNDENLGLATALNQGMRWAMERRCQWVLLFDQDTVPEDSMVETLMSVYDDFEPKRKLAVIGSNFYDINIQRVGFASRPNEVCSWAEKKTVITSGSLLSTAAFEAVGPFREEFFIDYVDHEYCLRARSMGFTIVLATKPIMKHAVGAATVHRLLWKNLSTSNHSPLRRYYVTRNHLILAREYLCKEPGWVFATSYWLVKFNTRMLLFEDGRASKLRNVLLGIWHGLAGRMDRR